MHYANYKSFKIYKGFTWKNNYISIMSTPCQGGGGGLVIFSKPIKGRGMVGCKILILKGELAQKGWGGWIFREKFGIFHEFPHNFFLPRKRKFSKVCVVRREDWNMASGFELSRFQPQFVIHFTMHS